MCIKAAALVKRHLHIKVRAKCDDCGLMEMMKRSRIMSGKGHQRYSQSLRVDELFGDVERSGSSISLCDREGKQLERNGHS